MAKRFSRRPPKLTDKFSGIIRTSSGGMITVRYFEDEIKELMIGSYGREIGVVSLTKDEAWELIVALMRDWKEI